MRGSLRSSIDCKKSSTNVEDLMISSNEQAKRGKRKEMIKSLKFLRIVGSKLRNETKTALDRRERLQSSKNVLSMPSLTGLARFSTPGARKPTRLHRSKSTVQRQSNGFLMQVPREGSKDVCSHSKRDQELASLEAPVESRRRTCAGDESGEPRSSSARPAQPQALLERRDSESLLSQSSGQSFRQLMQAEQERLDFGARRPSHQLRLSLAQDQSKALSIVEEESASKVSNVVTPAQQYK